MKRPRAGQPISNGTVHWLPTLTNEGWPDELQISLTASLIKDPGPVSNRNIQPFRNDIHTYFTKSDDWFTFSLTRLSKVVGNYFSGKFMFRKFRKGVVSGFRSIMKVNIYCHLLSLLCYLRWDQMYRVPLYFFFFAFFHPQNDVNGWGKRISNPLNTIKSDIEIRKCQFRYQLFKSFVVYHNRLNHQQFRDNMFMTILGQMRP